MENRVILEAGLRDGTPSPDGDFSVREILVGESCVHVLCLGKLRVVEVVPRLLLIDLSTVT